MMTFEKLLSKLNDTFPGKVSGRTQFSCSFIETDTETLMDLLTSLKDDFGFDYLVDITASHWPKRAEQFEVTYNLFAVDEKFRVFVKVKLTQPSIPTVSEMWKSALFLEREQYDLVGVTFEGHPDLRRILLPDFFKGHPLRKDFDMKDRSWFNSVDEQNLGIKFTK